MTSAGAVAKTARKPSAKAPIKVMLVDDHPLWRDTVRRIVERTRLARVVAEASSADEALERAAIARPAVVLMDIQLEHSTGIDATRRLMAQMPGLKVLVLASSDARAQVLEAIEAGACGYLLKTATSDEVRESVRRVNAGEMVFPPALSDVVLAEFRRRSDPSTAQPEPAGEALHNSLLLEGDYWTIVFRDEVIRIKDTRGVRYLAVLLRNPGSEIHALDLVAGGRAEHGLAAEGADAVLDPQAKSAYRQRLHDLQEELAEAEDWGDAERARRAREEIEAIGEELSSALGLGGRDRRAAGSAERARVNVTLALKPTLGKIAKHSQRFGDHLAATIKTGTYCSYTPDPRHPIRWS